MAAEITVFVEGRTVLVDIEPNTLQGLKKEFEEFCSEDEALRVRREKYAPTFNMYSEQQVLGEVKRKHVFNSGDKVFIQWTPLELEDKPQCGDGQVLKDTQEVRNDKMLASQSENRHAESETSDTEEYGLVQEYFTEDQWAKMPKYLKQRQQNKFLLNEQKLKAGLDVGPFKPEEYSNSSSSSCSSSPESIKKRKDDTDFANSQAEARSNVPKRAKVLRPVNLNQPSTSKAGSHLFDNLNQPSTLKAGSHLLDKEELMKVKPGLPHYDIPKILEDKLENATDDVHEMVQTLNKDGILTGIKRRMLIRILTKHLFYDVAKNPKEATPDMREGLAKSLVIYFPKFQISNCDGKTTFPWDPLFERGAGRGWIANAARSIQRKHRTKKSKRAKKSPVEMAEEDGDSDNAVEALALLFPGRAQRSLILDGMKDTFPERQNARRAKLSVTEMIQKFPHLAHYEGEVLQQEFKLMRPDAQDMSGNFQKKVPNILTLATSADFSLPLEDDIIKALMVMSSKLPRDIRSKGDPKGKSTAADLHDIIEIVQIGQNIEAFVSEKVEKATGTIQPYLILAKSPMRNTIVKSFIVFDMKPVEIINLSIAKCLDLLLQAYFVFNLQYPLGWRGTMHCLATCFAHVFEDKNPRCRPDGVTPSERDFMNTINQ